MKILIVADEPEKKYWDYYRDGCLDEFDLIISAGDLPSAYLSFLVTMAKCPVIYVHGNHDHRYENDPPDGCIDVEDTIYTFKGYRILGLGGSMLYNDGHYQYSDKEMNKRVKKLRWKLRKHKGFDILLTHAPAKDLNDGDDLCHRGFDAFISLIEKYKPAYFIHGHMHLNYGYNIPRLSTYQNTTVINGCGSYIIELEDRS